MKWPNGFEVFFKRFISLLQSCSQDKGIWNLNSIYFESLAEAQLGMCLNINLGLEKSFNTFISPKLKLWHSSQWCKGHSTLDPPGALAPLPPPFLSLIILYLDWDNLLAMPLNSNLLYQKDALCWDWLKLAQ